MVLTVHHLQVSQSERVVFLCEELGIEYELKNYQRSPLLAPPEYKALHALGSAPVIEDGETTLAESAACVEYINAVYGGNRLAVKPGEPGYADYLYWFHFANGSLQPGISRQMAISFTGAASGENPVLKAFADRMGKVFQLLDDQLEKTGAWLIGDRFTAADCMIMFSLSTMRSFIQVDLSPYKNILAYMERVSKRESYVRAMKKGDPELDVSAIIAGPSPPLFGPLRK
ncbi:hypothetical protein KC340_g3023 [Hortaea werneckii]|nr:hypothetical protein KC342_g3608 [Hortaea werneckii]KAI7103508.1 hypothetical protein KC339_g5203 [Hortaea werneckii]KAI7244216.1 hypothetical protein KC365_g1626 [Hortaea werneckii]KAI7333237.1 hypothetical protein KC340_g3023 [Hortaea werneckii]KAI7400221.1 hypothetical protein KC328_g3658 [Hortaea werneckii]